MTYQEKAKELIDKYCRLIGRKYFKEDVEKAKKAAIYEVTGIITALEDYGRENDELQNMEQEFRWWDKVEETIRNYKK